MPSSDYDDSPDRTEDDSFINEVRREQREQGAEDDDPVKHDGNEGQNPNNDTSSRSGSRAASSSQGSTPSRVTDDPVSRSTRLLRDSLAAPTQFATGPPRFLRELGFRYKSGQGWYHNDLHCQTSNPRTTYFHTIYISKTASIDSILLPVCVSCRAANPSRKRGLSCYYSRQRNSCRIDVYLLGWEEDDALRTYNFDEEGPIHWDDELRHDMDAEQQGIPRSRRYKLLRTTRVERSGIRHSARHVDNAENDENDAPNQGPSDSLVGPTIHLRDMARVLFSWVIPETFQQQEAELNASIELGRNQAMGLAPQVDDMQGDDFAADSQQSDHSSAGGMDMEVWQDDNFDPGDMGFPNNETQQTSDTHVPTPSVDLNATENAGPLGGIDTGLPELPLTANSGSSSSGSSPRMVRHTQPLVRYDYPVDWDIMPHRIRHLERREAELLAMVNDLCEEPTRQQLRSKEEELARLRKTLERLHLDNHYAAIHQSSQEVLLNRLKSALTARTAGEKRAISSSHDYQRLASSMTSQMMEFESLLVEERTRTEELEDDLKESRALCDRKDEENKEYHRKAHHALNLANARKDDLLRLDRSLAESRERIILRDRVISDLEQGLARANADILSLQTSKESLQTNLAHTERQLEDARKERRRVVERLYADIDHHQAQQSALQDLLKLSHAEHSRDMKAANLELKSEKVRRDQLQCQYSDLSEQLRSAQEELSRTTKRRLEDVELDEQIERLQAQKRSRRQGSPGKAAGDVP